MKGRGVCGYAHSGGSNLAAVRPAPAVSNVRRTAATMTLPAPDTAAQASAFSRLRDQETDDAGRGAAGRNHRRQVPEPEQGGREDHPAPVEDERQAAMRHHVEDAA